MILHLIKGISPRLFRSRRQRSVNYERFELVSAKCCSVLGCDFYTVSLPSEEV